MTITIEKYNQLSDVDRDSLCSLSGEKPEATLAIADRQLELSETVKDWTIALTSILPVCFFAYSLGLPESISHFIGGFFLILFSGIVGYLYSFILGMIIYTIFSKFFLVTHRQKFRLSVEKKWADLKSRQKAEVDQERYARQRVEAETAQKYQRDFDAIADYFAQGKTSLMPKSLLQFSVEELAEFVISRAAKVTEQTNLSAEKRSEFIAYYRHLSYLIPQIVDDEVVEVEETLRRLNDLVQDKNFQESIKSDLLNEYARISASDLIKNSRVERMKYFEKFEEMFPSLSGS